MDHPATLTARSQLAQVVGLTRYAEAEDMIRETSSLISSGSSATSTMTQWHPSECLRA